MVEVYMGKICTLKTYTANKQDKLVISIDDLINVYGKDCEGPKRHKELARECLKYSLDLIVKLDKRGIDTILDYGFWYKDERDLVRKTLDENDIKYKFKYFILDDNRRKEYLAIRNKTAQRVISLEKLEFFDNLFEDVIKEEVEICDMN